MDTTQILEELQMKRIRQPRCEHCQQKIRQSFRSIVNDYTERKMTAEEFYELKERVDRLPASKFLRQKYMDARNLRLVLYLETQAKNRFKQLEED